jgi:lipopolysaccharide transport protein LptA
MIRTCRTGWAIVWAALALSGIPTARAQIPEAAEWIEDEDVTEITSVRLTFDYAKNYAVFEENVVVIDPGMRLVADTLAVWFDKQGEVTLIKAEGRVRITQDDKIATAGEATYDVTTGKIVLVDSPRLQRGRHFLEGTIITYWRDRELLVVEPRSRLVIYPDESSAGGLNFFGQ